MVHTGYSAGVGRAAEGAGVDAEIFDFAVFTDGAENARVVAGHIQPDNAVVPSVEGSVVFTVRTDGFVILYLACVDVIFQSKVVAKESRICICRLLDPRELLAGGDPDIGILRRGSRLIALNREIQLIQLTFERVVIRIIFSQVISIFLVVPHVDGEFRVSRRSIRSAGLEGNGISSRFKLMHEVMQAGQRIRDQTFISLHLPDIREIEHHLAGAGERQIAADFEVAVHVDVARGSDGETTCGINETFFLIAVVHVHVAVRCVVSNDGDISVNGRTARSIAEAVADVAHGNVRIFMRIFNGLPVLILNGRGIPSFRHAVDSRHANRFSVLFRRSELAVDIYTATGNINLAVILIFRKRSRIFLCIFIPTCAVLGIARGGDIAVDGHVSFRVDSHRRAVEFRRAAEERITVRIDGKRAVRIEETRIVAAAAGGFEVIQREARAVDSDARGVVRTEVYPVKFQICLAPIGIDNGEERIISRAVLHIKSGISNAVLQAVFREVSFRIRQEGVQDRRRALINAPVFCYIAILIPADSAIRFRSKSKFILRSIRFICKLNGLVRIVAANIRKVLKRQPRIRPNVIGIFSIVSLRIIAV